MPPLSQIVSVNISVQDTVPTQAGFGTPLLLDYNTVYGPELVRTYSSVDAMTDPESGGFDVNSAAVKAAGAFFAQNPSVPFIKVGRRTNAPSMNFDLTFLTAIEGYTVDVAIAGPYGSTTNSVSVEIESGEAGDPSLVAAKVSAEIDALDSGSGIPNITTTQNGAVLNISTIAPGETPTILFRMKNAQGVIQNPEIHFSQDNDSPNAGVLNDYNAVKAEDNDFYGVILTSQSPDEYASLAGDSGVEGDVRLMVATSGDTDILSGGGLGQALNLSRTALLYHNQSFEYADAAWMGALFPTDPGSATWAFKTLVGISADILTDTQISELQSTYSNYYVTFAGVDITQTGRASSDRFLDITRGIDWLTARIQERVFTVLANAAKVPFTDTGIAIIETELRAQLQDAIDQGVLADSPAPSVSVPLAANVPVADRANRILPDVSFTAQLAGAIQEVQIVGTVTV